MERRCPTPNDGGGGGGCPPGFVSAKISARAASSTVFINVWREGDSRTYRKGVESEIDLLKLANRADVPCPRVVSELTQLNVSRRDGVHHRLVMHRLANDHVERCDLYWYTASLIKGVIRLHQAGILHCDIIQRGVGCLREGSVTR